jgi:hypothetical protein
MLKQINYQDPNLKDEVEELLNFHICSIEDRVDRLEIDVGHINEGEGQPLYLCRVVASDFRSDSLVVEERQANLALTVNRALSRIIRSLSRREQKRQSI